MTQSRLAEAAGTSQPAIAMYEGGVRSPSVDTLARVLAAAGRRLVLDTEERPARLDLSGPVGRRLRSRSREVRAVLKGRGVRDVQVFGSVARGEDGPDSDLDLLVRLPEGSGLFALGGLLQDLRSVLEIEVDIVTHGGLDEAMRKSIEPDLVPL